jgi:hypothetical protein
MLQGSWLCTHGIWASRCGISPIALKKFFFFFCGAGDELRAWHMLGKHSEPYPSPTSSRFKPLCRLSGNHMFL